MTLPSNVLHRGDQRASTDILDLFAALPHRHREAPAPSGEVVDAFLAASRGGNFDALLARLSKSTWSLTLSASAPSIWQSSRTDEPADGGAGGKSQTVGVGAMMRPWP